MKDSKGYIWVVEVRRSGWEALHSFDTRREARWYARSMGGYRRVRKYQRVGK